MNPLSPPKMASARTDTLTFLNHPIFLCGAPRSGTTLLANLLDAHPALFVLPMETHILQQFQATPPLDRDRFFRNDFLKTHDILSYIDPPYRNRFDSYLKDRYRTILSPQLPSVDGKFFKETYLSRFPSGEEISLRDVYQAFVFVLAQAAPGNGKTRQIYFVDKRPLDNELCALRLKEDFPNAKFIHMLRDPRTRYASAKQRRIQQRLGARYCRRLNGVDFASGHSEISLASFLLAEENQKRLGPDYLLVRYEELTADPEAVMRSAARFLSIEWDPILLRPTRLENTASTFSSFADLRGGEIQNRHSERLAQFRELTSRLERGLLSLHVRRAASRFGYAMEEPDPTWAELAQPLRHEFPPEFLPDRQSIAERLCHRNEIEEFVMNRLRKRWEIGIPTQD